jgi:hypothetical protein
MRKKTLRLEGVSVRGWECLTCSDTVLHPDDAQRMLVLSKLRRGLPVKVGELGKNLVVRIPKDIAKLYNLSKGEQITIQAESETKIGLNVSV